MKRYHLVIISLHWRLTFLVVGGVLFGWFGLKLHMSIATGILVLMVGHMLAALYHQYIRKDSLFARMWFEGR